MAAAPDMSLPVQAAPLDEADAADALADEVAEAEALEEALEEPLAAATFAARTPPTIAAGEPLVGTPLAADW